MFISVGRGTTSFSQVYLQLYTVVTFSCFCIHQEQYYCNSLRLCAVNLHDIVYCVYSFVT